MNASVTTEQTPPARTFARRNPLTGADASTTRAMDAGDANAVADAAAAAFRPGRRLAPTPGAPR